MLIPLIIFGFSIPFLIFFLIRRKHFVRKYSNQKPATNVTSKPKSIFYLDEFTSRIKELAMTGIAIAAFMTVIQIRQHKANDNSNSYSNSDTTVSVDTSSLMDTSITDSTSTNNNNYVQDSPQINPDSSDATSHITIYDVTQLDTSFNTYDRAITKNEQTFFWNSPYSDGTITKAYLIKDQEIIYDTVINGFAHCKFRNDYGHVTIGWISASDLSQP